MIISFHYSISCKFQQNFLENDSYLKVAEAPVGEREAGGDEQQGGEVPRIEPRSDQGHRAHLPVVAQCPGTQHQPTVERS